MTLYAAGEPTLLLTHMPLRNVPDGCVNVHGHLHNRQPPFEDATSASSSLGLPAEAVGDHWQTRPADRHLQRCYRTHDVFPA